MFAWPTLVILDFMVGNIGICQVIDLAKMQYFFTLVEKADPQKLLGFDQIPHKTFYFTMRNISFLKGLGLCWMGF